MSEKIKLLIHGESKVGKTWLSSTSPTPICLLDAEAGGMRFTPLFDYFVKWNPLEGPPPDYIDDIENPNYWEVCQVSITNSLIMNEAMNWLTRGGHPFSSIVVDSLSKFQQKLLKEEKSTSSGPNKFAIWDTLLTSVRNLIIDCMNMVETQENLKAFVCITGSVKNTDDSIRKPMLDGSMKDKIAYDFDCIGHLSVVMDEEMQPRRRLQLVSTPDVVAGNNLGGLLPDWIFDPNVSTMLETMNENRRIRKQNRIKDKQ